MWGLRGACPWLWVVPGWHQVCMCQISCALTALIGDPRGTRSPNDKNISNCNSIASTLRLFLLQISLSSAFRIVILKLKLQKHLGYMHRVRQVVQWVVSTYMYFLLKAETKAQWNSSILSLLCGWILIQIIWNYTIKMRTWQGTRTLTISFLFFTSNIVTKKKLLS